MKLYFALVMLLCAFFSRASTLPDFPFVAVTGQSSKQVAPDSAKLSFRITTFHASSDVAQTQLAQASSKVLALLKANGVTDSQISAFELEKTAKRKRDEQYNELDVLGYDLNRRFDITLADLKKYPDLMTQLYATDYVHDLSTSFDTSDRGNIETALIAAAAAQAKQKAEQMAEGLGVKIHSVFAFNDNGSFDRFFATFAAGESGMVSSAMMADRAAGAQQVFIPQSIEISKTVNVIYKITP